MCYPLFVTGRLLTKELGMIYTRAGLRSLVTLPLALGGLLSSSHMYRAWLKNETTSLVPSHGENGLCAPMIDILTLNKHNVTRLHSKPTFVLTEHQNAKT